MKMLLNVVAIVLLMIGVPSAFAETENPHSHHPQAAYKSGYQHGLADLKAGCPDRCHWYILEPGDSFAFIHRSSTMDTSLQCVRQV